MRYVVQMQYKGTRYHGWQKQHNALGVQSVLEQALSTLCKTDITTLGAGRTDTGVHAIQQFAQFDTDAISHPERFFYSLQKLLPWDISVVALYLAADTFSVRHDALHRAYLYAIHQQKDPFLDGLSTLIPGKIPDIELMNRAAQYLIKETNYASFCKYHTANTHFICNVQQAYWTQEGTRFWFHIKANRFLRGMVRGLVGSLWGVGIQQLSIADFEAIFAKQDRKAAGISMPPEGLYLTEVHYRDNDLKLLVSL